MSSSMGLPAVLVVSLTPLAKAAVHPAAGDEISIPILFFGEKNLHCDSNW